MKTRVILSFVVTAAILLPVGYASITSAQDHDRDRDQLKTQQQLQDRDKLQTKDQLREKDRLQEQERTRERTREQTHMERPEKPQHERAERGGGGKH